jgi:hypothetical protein
VDRHPEMARHLRDTLMTVYQPDAITRDPIEGRWRYWRNATGPTKWLFVVVDWDDPEPAVVTAYGQRKVRLP